VHNICKATDKISHLVHTINNGDKSQVASVRSLKGQKLSLRKTKSVPISMQPSQPIVECSKPDHTKISNMSDFTNDEATFQDI
jgi:hypothetical protein